MNLVMNDSAVYELQEAARKPFSENELASSAHSRQIRQ